MNTTRRSFLKMLGAFTGLALAGDDIALPVNPDAELPVSPLPEILDFQESASFDDIPITHETPLGWVIIGDKRYPCSHLDFWRNVTYSNDAADFVSFVPVPLYSNWGARMRILGHYKELTRGVGIKQKFGIEPYKNSLGFMGEAVVSQVDIHVGLTEDIQIELEVCGTSELRGYMV